MKPGRYVPPLWLRRACYWWGYPVTVFLFTRLLGAVYIVTASRYQTALTTQIAPEGYAVTDASTADPGYLGVATNWDGQWYWRIAEFGYPTELPLPGTEGSNFSEWAFYPGFPVLVRTVMSLSGLAFPVAATIVATTASLVGVIWAHRLMSETAGTQAARIVTLLLCCSMASPAFQIAYTDGLALMLLIASIWFLRKQRYLLAAAAVWGLALARPIAAPLLVVIAVHALVYHRRARPNAYRTRSLVLLAGSTVVATAAWPLLAAVVTKTPDAYTSAQSAWRLDDEVGPFGAFSVGYRLGGWPAVAVLVLLAAGLIGVASSKRAVAWGPELRAWAAAYPVYILSVVPVATSMFRFALLALPLLWVWPNALPNRLRWPCALALASLGLVTQWYWVRHFLVLGPIDLQVGMP